MMPLKQQSHALRSLMCQAHQRWPALQAHRAYQQLCLAPPTVWPRCSLGRAWMWALTLCSLASHRWAEMTSCSQLGTLAGEQSNLLLASPLNMLTAVVLAAAHACACIAGARLSANPWGIRRAAGAARAWHPPARLRFHSRHRPRFSTPPQQSSGALLLAHSP